MDYPLYQAFWRLQNHALEKDKAVKGGKAKETWDALLADVDKVQYGIGTARGMVRFGSFRRAEYPHDVAVVGTQTHCVYPGPPGWVHTAFIAPRPEKKQR